MARCIRVPKKDGERVRTSLIDADLLDDGYRIGSDGGDLLIPVRCETYENYPIEEFELKVQEHAPSDYREIVDVPDDVRELLPNSFDVIGDVAILKLEDPLMPYKHEIGSALMKVTPNIRTVMLDFGVKGDFRVRELEQISGSGPSETIHKEFGVRMLTDPGKVYFNPRLATERSRVASEIKDGEVIIDMFAGVAPFGVVICRNAHPEIVYAIDLNPEAEHFMRRNMELNHVTNIVPITGDAREVIKTLPDADRVIMNLPHMADQFLNDALRKTKVGGKIHLHKIIERSELEPFLKEIETKAKEDGLDMKIDSISELKTYSPTMSVYVLDIIRL